MTIITHTNAQRLARTHTLDLCGPIPLSGEALVIQFKGLNHGALAMSGFTSEKSWLITLPDPAAAPSYQRLDVAHIGGVAASLDGRYIAYGAKCSHVALIDRATSQIIKTWDHIWLHPNDPYKVVMRAIAFDDTSTRLFAGGDFHINLLYQAPEWTPRALWRDLYVQTVIAFTTTRLICLGRHKDHDPDTHMIRAYDLETHSILFDLMLGKAIEQASPAHTHVCYILQSTADPTRDQLLRVNLEDQTIASLATGPAIARGPQPLLCTAQGDLLIYLGQDGHVYGWQTTPPYTVHLLPLDDQGANQATHVPSFHLALDTTGEWLMRCTYLPPVLDIWQVASSQSTV